MKAKTNQQTWRYIPPIEASGKIHMTIDWWLLQQHKQGLHPPTLRFYTWSPPAISLGYHQYKYPEFWHNITWQGKKLDIVRRPTGGRAVLHQGDLTYMVVTSSIEGNRQQVYQKICKFLIQGWYNLGIDVDYGTNQRGYIHNPNCFGTATAADLIDSHGKLIGSAQLRQKNAILQHGTMILSSDPDLFTKVFNRPFPRLNQFPFESEELIPKLIKTLTEAAKTCFNMELVTQPLSKNEWQQILRLSQKLENNCLYSQL